MKKKINTYFQLVVPAAFFVLVTWLAFQLEFLDFSFYALLYFGCIAGLCYFIYQFKWLRRIFFGFVTLLFCLLLLLRTSWVQNWAVEKLTTHLGSALGTTVSIKNISVGFFSYANLNGVLVKDKQQDTLLYAQHLRLRITDWLFSPKDRIDIKYIGLENAVVKLRRKTAEWNYNFIVEYFGSAKDTTRAHEKFSIYPKKIDIKNLHFMKDDQWIGETFDVQLQSLVINAPQWNIADKIWNIDDIAFDKLKVKLKDYDGLRPPLKLAKNIVDTGLQLNPQRLRINLKRLNIKRSQFTLDADEEKPYPYFDGAHIDIASIDADFKDIRLLNDTIRADIVLSCKERSGIEIKKLKAKYRVTPEIMEFAQLDLKTNNSELGNYFAMHYNSFNADFADFTEKVLMKANFVKGKIATDDIAYFAPELKDWHKEGVLMGDFAGKVNNFEVKKMFLQIGDSYIQSSLSMQGLPNIDQTKINLDNAILQTQQKDLAVFIPVLNKLTEVDLASLGRITYKGNFRGYINNFKAEGVLNSTLGSLTTAITMQFPKNEEPLYFGKLITKRFNLGKLIRREEIKNIDFEGSVDGTSFELEKLKTKIEGVFHHLEVNNYNYANITTNGTIQKKYFKGELKITDPNLDFLASVDIDYSSTVPSINMFGDLVKSNLKKLNITKDNIEFTATLDANFKGTNIDNFLGEAKILNTHIKKDTAQIKFDALTLNSYYRDSVKNLDLKSDLVAATIAGNFQILQLPASFKTFLSSYFPTFISKTNSNLPPQNFSFTVETNKISPLLQLFDEQLKGFNYSMIEGILSTTQNQLSLRATVPAFSYYQYNFKDIVVQATGDKKSIHIDANAQTIYTHQNNFLPPLRCTIDAANDSSIIKIKTLTQNGKDAILNAQVLTSADGWDLTFRESSFYLGDKLWTIQTNGNLAIKNKTIYAKNLNLNAGFQEIAIETPEKTQTPSENLNVFLKNITLHDITSLINFTDPAVDGLLSGKLELNTIFSGLEANAKLKIEQLNIAQDSVGNATIDAQYIDKSKQFSWTINIDNPQYDLTAKGKYFSLKDTDSLILSADIRKVKLHFLHPYLKDIFDSVEGAGTGKLVVKGPTKNLEILGSVEVKNAKLKVGYTKVNYYIDAGIIKFDKAGIDLGSLTIYDNSKDALQRNQAIVKGRINEKNFANFVYDIDMQTDKLLLLNTTARDNENLYGRAIGQAQVSFKGPETKAVLKIVAEANEASQIYIPNSFTKETGDADFIVFKEVGTEMAAASKTSNLDILIDMDFTVSNRVAMYVIFDELSGDVLKATGNGRLKIKTGTTQNLEIRGRYNVEEGAYDFNFQSLIRRPFYLLPTADNYIEWTGDPMNATLHIDAQYNAENVSLGGLLNTTTLSGNDNRLKAQRGTVYVIAELRNKLSNPSFRFKIDFPPNSLAKNNTDLMQLIARMEKNETEILVQATSLIVFQAFTPYGQGFLSGETANYSSAGINSISQKVTAQINKQVSQWLNKLDKNLKFDFGASVYSASNLYNKSGIEGDVAGKIDRTNFKFHLERQLFNDNIIVSLGSDIDFSMANNALQNNNLQWLPAVNVEFILSKDRKLRAIVFYKNSLMINTSNALGRTNRWGVTLSYRVESDSFNGLLNIKTKDSSANN